MEVNVTIHEEKAKALFCQGYNCTQAVVGAFCEDMGLDMEQAARMVSAFGGGMGRLREVCGTVSGMWFVLGYYYGYSTPKDNKSKTELYAHVQKLASRFRAEHGSIICRELLGMAGVEASADHVPEERTPQYYKKRPCAQLAGFAAKLLDEYMEETPPALHKEAKKDTNKETD